MKFIAKLSAWTLRHLTGSTESSCSKYCFKYLSTLKNNNFKNTPNKKNNNNKNIYIFIYIHIHASYINIHLSYLSKKFNKVVNSIQFIIAKNVKDDHKHDVKSSVTFNIMSTFSYQITNCYRHFKNSNQVKSSNNRSKMIVAQYYLIISKYLDLLLNEFKWCIDYWHKVLGKRCSWLLQWKTQNVKPQNFPLIRKSDPQNLHPSSSYFSNRFTRNR